MSATDRGARAARRYLNGAMAVALGIAACDAAPEQTAPNAPSGSAEGTVTYGVDGTVTVDAFVRVQMYGTEETEEYAFEGITFEDAAPGEPWTIESVDYAPEGWPVRVTGPLAFETRALTVRATRPGFDAILAPVFTARLSHEGATLTARIPSPLAETHGACPLPDVAPLLASLGGELAWSRSTVEGAVDLVLDMRVDPLERTYVAAQVEGGIFRLFAVSPAWPTALREVAGVSPRIAPGTGSGPTVSALTVADDGLSTTKTVQRFDADLKPVWSRSIEDADSVVGGLGESGGLVLVTAHPTGALVIDGVERAPAEPGAHHLVLFDQSSGDFVASRTFTHPGSVAGIGGGAFALLFYEPSNTPNLAVLEADLSERWRRPLDPEARSVAIDPDGSIWINAFDAVQRFDVDGNELGRVETSPFTTLAPIGDGRAVIAGARTLGIVSIGAQPVLAEWSGPPAWWCDDVHPSFSVAPGPKGPVLGVAVGSPGTPEIDGLATFGGLSL